MISINSRVLISDGYARWLWSDNDDSDDWSDSDDSG